MITKTKPNQTKPNQTKFYRQKYSDILAFDFAFLFFYSFIIDPMRFVHERATLLIQSNYNLNIFRNIDGNNSVCITIRSLFTSFQSFASEFNQFNFYLSIELYAFFH